MNMTRILTLSGTLLLGVSGALANDGKENRAIRDDVYQSQQAPAVVPQQLRSFESRASTTPTRAMKAPVNSREFH